MTPRQIGMKLRPIFGIFKKKIPVWLIIVLLYAGHLVIKGLAPKETRPSNQAIVSMARSQSQTVENLKTTRSFDTLLKENDDLKNEAAKKLNENLVLQREMKELKAQNTQLTQAAEIYKQNADKAIAQIQSQTSELSSIEEPSVWQKIKNILF